jgi:hypothetical protein
MPAGKGGKKCSISPLTADRITIEGSSTRWESSFRIGIQGAEAPRACSAQVRDDLQASE